MCATIARAFAIRHGDAGNSDFVAIVEIEIDERFFRAFHDDNIGANVKLAVTSNEERWMYFRLQAPTWNASLLFHDAVEKG